MIRLEGLSKRFGEIEALVAIDLEISTGERLAVLGRNGSGKTTLLRTLVGLSRPSGGRLLVRGEEPRRENWREFHRRLGFMPERVVFHENLTGAKTLDFFARLRGVDHTEVGPMLERVGLSGAAGKRVGLYSKGMRQRLNLAQALLGKPDVLVLDEPLEGLDSRGVRLFFELVESVEGRTVVFSSHRLTEVSGFVDRVCVMNRGEVRALGSEEDLRSELDLPLRVTLHAAADAADAVISALSGISPDIANGRNSSIVLTVSQSDKIQFLSRLHSFADAIHQVHFEEPTLEEVLTETD